MTTFAIAGRLTVNRLGYGTGQLTGFGYWGERLPPEDAVAVLRRAVERGATLIDTADNYGPDLAEELVARALHPYGDGLVLATKGGVIRTGPNVWHIDGRPASLRARCEASLRRLRVETVDLYQLHRIDPEVPLADQLGTLAELRTEGKIRHIGLDTVTPEELAEAMTITEIASVQNRYNLLDRDSEPVLELCEARGLAFLPWFPLGNGKLTAAEGSPLAEVAARHGATPNQVALAWLLHRSPVLLPTPGTGSLAHLEENMDAAALRLTDQDMEALAGAAA
ncbi:putative oxidoreductase [[Actinomadura] parvosata subsp. kistnae]|uniref:Oxidoreductase n=1 Tax=[Actinomadura] parvosata subsp. kistnae TaxID=1909395 RepID=A0A1V0A151_9ACTN|nr:aldo/keto reductase [Nonomuraea sp. ATCC 55076]AQZ63892.1 oxidoreductase [Nonomuraea sp. ATCC 55076]SPL89738.1 putative oxidoreductase [Actinomadura parvosata subsp. kistnae]